MCGMESMQHSGMQQHKEFKLLMFKRGIRCPARVAYCTVRGVTTGTAGDPPTSHGHWTKAARSVAVVTQDQRHPYHRTDSLCYSQHRAASLTVSYKSCAPK